MSNAKGFTDLLAKAEALGKNDAEALRKLIDAVVNAALPDLERDAVLKKAAKASGFRLEELRKNAREKAAQRAKETKSSPKTLEKERAARDRERRTLFDNCCDIAKSPTLLADMEKIAHRLGVIGEGAAIRATYLTFTSRLLKTTAICLVRRGAPSSGKNFVPNIGLKLFPPESVFVFSSSSPLALVYEGEADDVDALKHMFMYVPEAVFLARRANGDEPPAAAMIRSLISEGRIDHRVVVPQPQGPHKTIHIRRDGPIAMCITSARDNIEAEMMTRLMSSDADETVKQTKKVVANVFSNARPTVPEDEIGRWVDFQRWLAIDAPYDVSIPFAEAIFKAWDELAKEFPADMPLRTRRDAPALKAAIEASAVLHKAQRKKDAAGRIIAETADYAAAQPSTRGWPRFMVSGPPRHL